MFNYQRVGIKKDTLVKLSQLPAVQFSEGHTEVRSGQELKVRGVETVNQIYDNDDVEYIGNQLPRDINNSCDVF